MSSDEQKSFWTLAKPFLRKYLPRYKWGLIFGIISGVIAAAAAGFGLPVIVQAVVPIVFGAVEAPEWLARVSVYCFPNADLEYAIMWMAALFVPFVMSLRGIATYLNTYLLARTGLGMMTDLRTDVFARLQYLPFSFYDKNTRGKLMTTVIQYTQSVQQQLTQILNDLVVQPLTLVAAIAYLVYAAVSNHYAAVLLGNLIIKALCIPLVRCVGKRMVKKMRKVMESMNTVTADVEEALAAQREVRSFNLQKHREQILSASITRFSKSIIRMEAWRAAVAPAIEFVSALALAYSLYRSSGNGLTLSQFTAIATAFYFCYDPIKRLGALANGCQVMGVLIDGINEIIEAKDETPEPAHPRPLPVPVTGAVEFRNVIFSYNEEKTVLKDVSVSVPAGQIVALVGPSGSGKTTFINLICRFYDPVSGTIRIDGVDVKDITREDRTRNIGLVSQFSALFHDTVFENIRLGRPGASDEEVRAAAGMARVDEFVDSLPGGYGYMMGESGSGLSGGQRQRVSIARAFLKNAPVLILDEATSALDMRSEAAIQDALDDLTRGHTTFIIAHRFSTLRMAQRILVFEAGRIIADGTHQELYENCLLYRGLYDEQVRQEQEVTE